MQRKRTLKLALQQAAPILYRLLRESVGVDAARDRLFTHLQKRERALYAQRNGMHPIEHATARQCIQVLKSILAPRNEAMVEFSTLEHLWHVVRGDGAGIEDGFLQEFIHLFQGINGQSSMAKGWLGPALEEAGVQVVDFNQVKGRKAGKSRSDFLDAVGAQIWSQVERFPSGLDSEMIQRRESNKAAIIDFFDTTPRHWESYAWQLGHIFTGPDALSQLEQLIPMTSEEKDTIRLCAEHNIPFGITPYYLSLFDFDSADRTRDAAVRAQVIPPMRYVEHMIAHSHDREHAMDFMREHDTSPIDLVTRRYASVAILKGYDTCPQICVYCQRNWSITGPMAPNAMPHSQKLDAALDWFAEHPHIRDVLITGGDPFFVSDRRIAYTMERLAQMDHVVNIRWGTRSLVTMPMRVTGKLAEILSRYIEPGRRNVAVVTHVQSPLEVTPAVAAAVYRLREHGLRVYNQQVFTVHNSRRFQTVANRMALKKIGIDPYYTFYPKGKEETWDYLTPLARILQERKEEARLLPGIFRTDEPVFNVPRLGKNHVRAWQDRELVAIRPDGRRVYLWHPWEKGITPVEPWLYVDSSIEKYLHDVERLGEDRAQYASIWYYY